MTTMKAIRFHDWGDSSVLRYEDIERPVAKAGEVLIRVKAIGLNPVDWKLRSGVGKRFGLPLPLVVGADIAGVVESVGEGVTAFKAGDEVFSMIGLWGAYQEYVSVKADFVAPKPKSMDFVQAASVPLAALTAWQGMFEKASLQAGQTALVYGAAGGVGMFGVQFAKAKGARVVATASAKNADFVRGLGADDIVDYRTDPASRYPQNVDLALDMIGGDAADHCIDALKNGGAHVQVSPGGTEHLADKAAAKNVARVAVQVHPDGGQLREIAALIDAGKVKTEVAAVFSLADTAKAQDLSAQGHTRGKIVLTCG